MAYHKAKEKGHQLSFAELREAVEQDPLTQEVGPARAAARCRVEARAAAMAELGIKIRVFRLRWRYGRSRFQRTGRWFHFFILETEEPADLRRPARPSSSAARAAHGWAFVFGQQGCVFPKPASYPAPRLVRQPFL